MPNAELERTQPRPNPNGSARARRDGAAAVEPVRELAANAPGVIVLLGQDGHVLALSAGLCGRAPRDCLGRPLAATLGGELGRAVELAIAQLSDGAPARDGRAVEVEGCVRDGERRTYRVRLSALASASTSGAAFSAFVSDITEQAARERALREREALLSRTHKSAQLAFMAGGLAHDLNNLLTIIVGSADLLCEEAPPGSDQRIELGQIQRAGERAVEITRNLLAFSRREASVPRALDLEARVRDLEDVLERLLGPGIRLEIRCAPDLWRAWVDPLHAEHVITHLALEARHAMPHGGTLRLALANLDIPTFQQRGSGMVGSGQYVELRVQDSGPGMNEAARAVAFEPFFSARHGELPADLSLPLVRSLVTQALGHIWLETTPGQGRTFTILYPRAK